jgi:hypothetical protein
MNNKANLGLVVLAMMISCKEPVKNQQVTPEDTKFLKFEYEEMRYINANGGLRLRAEPNSKSKVTILVPECAHVFQAGRSKETETINGVTGFWAKLRYPGQKNSSTEGWGFEPYLSTQLPHLPITQKSMTSFKTGCLSITGDGACMGCGSIDFYPNGIFRIAYDCHLFGDGKWQIKGDRIVVESNQYIGGCGHFENPEKCEKAPKGPSVYYEFKLSTDNSWFIKTDSDQWKSKDFLHWSNEWNSVGKMYCLRGDQSP